MEDQTVQVMLILAGLAVLVWAVLKWRKRDDDDNNGGGGNPPRPPGGGGTPPQQMK